MAMGPDRRRAEATHRVGALLAAALLVATAPAPPAAWASLRTAASAADPTAPLVALLALAGWLLLTWLGAVAAMALISRVPGRIGRVATLTCRRVAPAAVRRAVEVMVGVTVAVGVVGSSPASASPAVPPAPPAAAASLDWPEPRSAPALDWNPGRLAPPAIHATQPRPAAVVVQPGDSLWAVAARHLPPGASDSAVARAWPSWWTANRDVIGDEPDVIHPGLRLTPPT
jgi:hypothetical protein